MVVAVVVVVAAAAAAQNEANKTFGPLYLDFLRLRPRVMSHSDES